MFGSYKIYLRDLLTGGEQNTTKIPKHLVYSLITIFAVNIATYLVAILLGDQDEYIKQRARLSYAFSWFYLLLTVCVFPLLEELSFRLFLSLKRNHILVSLSMIYAFFLGAGILFLFKDEVENDFLLFIGISSFLFVKSLVMLSVPFLNHPPMSKLLAKVFRSHFKIIYFGSAILFGLIHLVFQSFYSESSYLINILFFLSYFISGLVFNSGRMAIGFIYVVVLHMAINLMAFL